MERQIEVEGSVDEKPRWRITYSHAKARRVKGKSGYALDLSANASIRKATSQKNPLEDHIGDFTVSVWVKGDLLSDYGNYSFDLIGATHDIDDCKDGWKIGVQASGAWYWQVTEKDPISYEPQLFDNPFVMGSGIFLPLPTLMNNRKFVCITMD